MLTAAQGISDNFIHHLGFPCEIENSNPDVPICTEELCCSPEALYKEIPEVSHLEVNPRQQETVDEASRYSQIPAHPNKDMKLSFWHVWRSLSKTLALLVSFSFIMKRFYIFDCR